VDPLERLSSALSDRYRLERELGQGGMATVYLAEDLKHKRKVALKVLRPELAAVLGADRFVQEITTTAALQHPHILPLFDSGTADGFLYYVMPYIQGETLRSKLDRETQLGIEEAVRITTNVADALDYAHRHGVIHRDIKPENILLHEGRPMVADFGIALAVSAAAGGRMTETGLSLGTPHYMSPEQATAEKEITARSDIYSLGSVLCEMLTGSPPHTGASAQQIIMKIVTEEAAPVTRLRKAVPPHVAAAVAKALEKLPADRFESATEFARALLDAHWSDWHSGNGSPAASSGWGQDRRTRRLITAGVIAVVVAALAGRLWRSEASAPPPTVLTLGLPPHLVPLDIRVSPDGRRVVIVGRDETLRNSLYLRDFESPELRALTGTEGATSPFFSPDGQSVAFVSRGALWKLRLSGGRPEVVPGSDRGLIDQGGGIHGGAWGPGDSLIVSPRFGRLGLWLLAPGLEEPVRIVPRDSTDRVSFSGRPHWMAGGGTLLISTFTNDQPPELTVVSAADGSRRGLGITGTNPIQSGDRLFFLRDNLPHVVDFDRRRREVRGKPVLLAGMPTETPSGATFDIALAGGGTVVFLSAPEVSHWLVEVSPDGSVSRVFDERRRWESPRASPDGRFIAAGIFSPSGRSIWVLDRDRQALTRFTLGESAYPAWSPRGDQVAFADAALGGFDVTVRRRDAAGTDTTLLSGTQYQFPEGWTPDMGWLVYRENLPDTREDIRALDLLRGTTRDLANSAASELQPALSPDGRRLAYVSDESGQAEAGSRINRGAFRCPCAGVGNRAGLATDAPSTTATGTRSWPLRFPRVTNWLRAGLWPSSPTGSAPTCGWPTTTRSPTAIC